jgi:putative hemolysin
MRCPMKIILLVFIVALVLSGCTSNGSQESQAAAYCEKNGGKVEERVPFYTGAAQAPLRMAGSLNVCTFKKADQSSITISLNTLYTSQPTLAASAYLARPAATATGASTEAASKYCTQLGGTDLFEGSSTGGGWGYKDGTEIIPLCIFPDLSAIDSWGLLNNAYTVVRGADLSTLLRYQLDQSKKPFQPTP